MISSLCYKLMPVILGSLGFLFGLGCYLAETKSPQSHTHLFYWSFFFIIQTTSGVLIGWLIKRLYYSAFTDGLTGLWNYRFFYDSLNQLLGTTTPCSLVYLDLDNFKYINDCHGHQAGDEALRQLSLILRQNCRQQDIVARLGGDEFALLLPKTTVEDALLTAERIRLAAQKQLSFQRATVSAGVTASWPEATTHRLIALADQALYKAKNGKNQVIYLTSAEAAATCSMQ